MKAEGVRDRIDSEPPCGWVETTLGAMHLDLATGVNPARTPNAVFELYSVPSHELGVPEIMDGKGIGSNKRSVEPGTVLFCKINPRINRVWVTGDHSPNTKIASTEWISFFPFSQIEPRYLAYFLRQNAVRDFAAGNASGVGGSLMRVRAETFRDFRFQLAPRIEQARIADTLDELFSDLNDGVAALEQARDKLKLYRAAVLKAAVEGALTADWRESHPDAEPAGELLKRILVERRRRWEEDQLRKFEEKGKTLPKNWKAKYKEPVAPDTTSLPPLPARWCWATFASLASQRLGKMLDKSKNVGPLRPYLRNLNTRWFSFDLDDLAEMRIGDEEFPDVSVRFGDLVVCEGGEPGRCAVWDRKNETIAIQKALHRVRPSRGVSSQYLSFVLAEGTHSGRLQKSFTGTGINHLTGESLASYPVPLPPSAEQEAIVAAIQAQLSVVEQLEADIDAKLQSAQALRQSILKHAFTGKLVPQDPDDEPASELLQRIAAERKARVQEAAAAKRRRLASRRSRK